MVRNLALALFTAAALAQAAAAATITFVVPLDGQQEVNGSGVPGQGDLDGSGTATLMIDDVTNTISWNIVVNNIVLPLSAAHIHAAPAGTNGSPVVDFSGQLTGSGLVDADLAAVLANPSNFYVNLHNSVFPAGALRGQLGTPVVEPVTLALLALAGGSLALRRRSA